MTAIASETSLGKQEWFREVYETSGERCLRGIKWIKSVLDKHTDLISSLGILAITTCLLAAKIFKSMPPLLPKVANVVFSYGGIIWLNVQVQDFMKSCRDERHAIARGDVHGVIETAAKVFVKGVNILLTVTTFGASIIAAVGFPQVTLAIYLAIRPLALGSLGINICSDIRDYFANSRLLKDFEDKERDDGTEKVALRVGECFRSIVVEGKGVGGQGNDYHGLAFRSVRQLNTYTLGKFKEDLEKGDIQKEGDLYERIKQSIQGTQTFTKANLFLTGLGYLSMGVCKAYPETILEKGTRLAMSILYTGKLIYGKMI